MQDIATMEDWQLALEIRAVGDIEQKHDDPTLITFPKLVIKSNVIMQMGDRMSYRQFLEECVIYIRENYEAVCQSNAKLRR